MPYSQRLMKDKELDIRADIAAAILNEGQFNTPALGLTVFLRELSPDGEIKGILVHDNRNAKLPTTYIAEHGVLAQTPLGPRLIMLDGTIEQSSRGGAELSVLKFQRYVFDLDQFSGQQGATELRTSERYLSELLWPKFARDPGKATRDVYFAEANNRLSEPLYCVAFALIAFAAITLGRRGRGAYALRLALAVLGAAALRILGYGIQGAAARHPAYCVLFYLIPLTAAGIAYLDISGFDLSLLADRLRPTRLEPAA
jgi:lipopolysaccharide export system permease protein